MFNFSRDDEGSVRLACKFKYQDVRMMKHKHNPYVGSFHSVPRRDITEDPRSENFISIGNVPMLRHAPPSLTNIFPVVGLSLGLKGLFHQDEENNSDVNTDDSDAPSFSPFALLAPMLSQVNISRIKVLEKNKNLSLTALKKIPIIIFQNITDAKSPLSPNEVTSSEECPMCSICLETYKDGDELRSLNCNHCFHKKCVDIWLLGYFSSGTVNTCRCPQCRGEVSVSPDFYESEILDSDTSSSFLRIGESMIINEEISSLSSSAISEIEPPSISDFISNPVAIGGNNSSNSIVVAVENSLDDGVLLVDDDNECLCGSGYSFCDAVDLNALILSDEL